MFSRAAGAAFPILFGVYLLYSHLAESQLFKEGPQAKYNSVVSALGAFLLILGVGFLYKNLK